MFGAPVSVLEEAVAEGPLLSPAVKPDEAVAPGPPAAGALVAVGSAIVSKSRREDEATEGGGSNEDKLM